MNPNYTPIPGSVEDRAITYLRKQPDGAEVVAGRLAGACEVYAAALPNVLRRALDNGAIFRRQNDGKAPWLYSLVDHSAEAGKPLPRAGDVSVDADGVTSTVVMADDALGPWLRHQHMGEPAAAAEPAREEVVEACASSVDTADPDSDGARIAAHRELHRVVAAPPMGGEAEVCFTCGREMPIPACDFVTCPFDLNIAEVPAVRPDPYAGIEVTRAKDAAGMYNIKHASAQQELLESRQYTLEEVGQWRRDGLTVEQGMLARGLGAKPVAWKGSMHKPLVNPVEKPDPEWHKCPAELSIDVGYFIHSGRVIICRPGQPAVILTEDERVEVARALSLREV